MSTEPARAVWFLDDAEDDVAATFEWYESRRVGLGVEFVCALDATLAALLEFPESCPVVYRDTRRHLMGRFPFEVLYRLEDGLLVVTACIHAARDPKAVLRRIGG
ncbi:MAG: type II toxin-antitoxin system RelE/ParE family toxin [Thermoleophilia bacterium]|nr:type II toxin-antitoxin system RelE/ParE family toxin [Thermoleophilia bacterium]